MFVRLLIALLASPWYGFLAALATLPLLAAGALGWGMIASVVPGLVGPGSKLDDLAVLIVMGLFLAVMLLALQIAVIVQMARYAAAFTGAIRLRDQPVFLRSFLRGLLVIVLVWIFFGLVSFVLGALIGASLGSEASPAQTVALMLEWQAQVTQYLATGEIPEGQGQVVGWAVLAARVSSMLYMVLLALIMVPYVCGISSESGLSWTPGYVLFRIVVAIPCCALMTAILIEMLISAGELIGGDMNPGLRVLLMFSLESLIFAGVVFAFEAMLLRGGREVVIEEQQARVLDEQRSPDEYASMLRQRMQQE